MTDGIDRHRRKEIARESFDVPTSVGIDGDPYWLTNLHGRVDEDALLRMAEKLREDADLLEEAHEKVTSDEWLPSEAALYIAENANHGDYMVYDHMYDGLPVTGESDEW